MSSASMLPRLLVLLLVLAGLLGALLGWLASAEGVKSQLVRLLDVILFGPFFVAVGVLLARRLQLPRAFALAIGVTCIMLGASTATYNLRNYFGVDRKEVVEAATPS